jgi:hypothetical protein
MRSGFLTGRISVPGDLDQTGSAATSRRLFKRRLVKLLLDTKLLVSMAGQSDRLSHAARQPIVRTTKNTNPWRQMTFGVATYCLSVGQVAVMCIRFYERVSQAHRDLHGFIRRERSPARREAAAGK